MKSKLLKRIAIAASFALAMGMVTVFPKINGDPLFGITVTATTDPARDFSYKANDSESVTVTKYNNGSGGNIEIPSEINGKAVTDIGNAAFRKCKSLKSITFPDSVKSIGGHTFSGCTELTIYGCNSTRAKRYADEEKIPFKYICEYPQNAAGHDYVEGICTVCGADDPKYSRNQRQ